MSLRAGWRAVICCAGLIALGPQTHVWAQQKPNEVFSPFNGSLSEGVRIDLPSFHGVEPRLSLAY